MNKFYLGIAVLFTSAMFTFGQADRGRPAGTQPSGPEKQVTVFSETALATELQSTLDVKSAKVGDEVVLKTAKAVRQNGETVIPKGTSLLGRVTEVQRKTKENGTSRLGMVFDRIEGKNLSGPITATILTITDVRSAASLGDSLTTDSAMSSSTSASSSSGGGLLGGGGLGSTLGGVTSTAGSALGTVTNTAGRAVETVTTTAGTAAGTTTTLAGQTLNGIQLSNSTSGSASGSSTLSAQTKNVRLQKGVTFHLALSSQAGN